MALADDLRAYEPDALFKCSATSRCGTIRRDRCISHKGLLMCPTCKYISTLVFTGRLDRAIASATPTQETNHDD